MRFKLPRKRKPHAGFYSPRLERSATGAAPPQVVEAAAHVGAQTDNVPLLRQFQCLLEGHAYAACMLEARESQQPHRAAAHTAQAELAATAVNSRCRVAVLDFVPRQCRAGASPAVYRGL